MELKANYEWERFPLDPFPFRVGRVRLSTPGTLNGERTENKLREIYGHTIKEAGNSGSGDCFVGYVRGVLRVR